MSKVALIRCDPDGLCPTVADLFCRDRSGGPPVLTVFGKRQRFCDRVSRRDFLRIGGLALGGLSTPEILPARARSGTGSSKKDVIMVFLSGGPPHQDMVDLKSEAPAEIRGEFNPIATNVPGIEICEHLPRLARITDKLAILRSIVGSEGHHASFQCMTGWTHARQPQGGWPSLGSAGSRLLGPTRPRTPAFVGLSPPMKSSTWADPGQPGFLGMAHAPFKPSAEGKADMVLSGVSLDRLGDRQALRASFDRFRREVDATGAMEGL